MIVKNQLLDYSTPWSLPDVYFFTANSVVGKNGLIMGAGNALAVKKAYSKLPFDIAPKIRHKFGVIFQQLRLHQFVGAFQTKYHWRDSSPIELVEYSTKKLIDIAINRSNITFHLPFPAINNGGLDYNEVLKIVDKLPDNVILYKL